MELWLGAPCIGGWGGVSVADRKRSRWADDAFTASMGGRSVEIGGLRRLDEEAQRTDLDGPEKQAEVAGQTVVQTRPTLECSNAEWRCRDKCVGISG